MPDVPEAVWGAIGMSATKPHFPTSPVGLEQGLPTSEALNTWMRLLPRSQAYRSPSLLSLAQCSGLRKNAGLIVAATEVRRPLTDALTRRCADRRRVVLHRILSVRAEVPDVLPSLGIDDEHAPIAVTVGDVQEVRLRIDSHVRRQKRLRRAVDAAIGVVAVRALRAGVADLETNVPSALNFNTCESLPKFGAHGNCPWKFAA